MCMKRHVFIIFFAIFSTISFFLTTMSAKAENFSHSTAEIVMELNSNRVLHSKNAKEKKFMASTTKILTAITIIENTNLDEIVTVTKETVGVEGSSIYLRAGEKLSVKELLYGLMLRSGNDCAETLAVHCSGSIDGFAKLMNETAIKIGAIDSNFKNPHGLHDDNHYTTAYDLALISCYAMKNYTFREIVSTKSIKISNTLGDYKRVLVNKNKLLNSLDGATGIKTGYTKKAGRCLVSSCYRDGVEYISVVLNCGPMFERSTELLNSTFNNYKVKKLVESDHVLAFIPIENSSEKCGVIIKGDISLPLSKTEEEKLIIKINIPKIIKKPIKKDENIGTIEFYLENNLIFSEKIYTIIDVN